MNKDVWYLMWNNQYREGAKEKVLCKITYSSLANLFQVSIKTITRWINSNKFDPSDLISIINFYQQEKRK